jgi:hypothetical protein
VLRKYVLNCVDMSRFVFISRAYTSGLLIKSVLFRCHYNDDKTSYPTIDSMSKHLNKTSHKISFLAIRDTVGSTSFTTQDPPLENLHSFGVPRYFFRLNLTSAISGQPYGYVHWVMFNLHTCHRASFEGSMTRDEWMTGPTERPNISPFCYLEDVIPSRFALGTFVL